MRVRSVAAITVVITCVSSGVALAHKVVAGAFASGDRIEGEIGFSDGSMAANALVEVLAEDGRKLGEVRTEEDGTFVYTPTEKVPIVFRADLGAGHVAEVHLSVDELPARLRAGSSAGVGAPSAAVTPSPTAVAAEGSAEAPATASATASALEAQRTLLAELVRNEVRPLRREIIALKEKNDLQSILGGIGYIFGLFGLWFFFAARRANAKAAGR
ncbi:Additional component NikL of nickel ECF transporter [Rhodovulum sp. PH10]|uniref:hypothetical protein n=1 Tax=Rhodovulum sp. PH10 TaxID=1187851 RepID=UPI00027C22C8|nr:hypothetical protein [Rhodovulum sp. PH10]EJW09299.1 Additional component NikL of nickel ECF transporter [Rhodovulum sp. PH10]